MTPAKVDRASVRKFTDLPNVGPAMAADLRLLDYVSPGELAGQCPFAMYRRLCEITGQRHDPCVIDVFMSVVDFVDGGPPRPGHPLPWRRPRHRLATLLRWPPSAQSSSPLRWPGFAIR